MVAYVIIIRKNNKKKQFIFKKCLLIRAHFEFRMSKLHLYKLLIKWEMCLRLRALYCFCFSVMLEKVNLAKRYHAYAKLSSMKQNPRYTDFFVINSQFWMQYIVKIYSCRSCLFLAISELTCLSCNIIDVEILYSEHREHVRIQQCSSMG